MVIQRWQSLLLLIVAVLMGVFTFCSLGQVQTFTNTVDITTLGLQLNLPSNGGQSPYAVKTIYILVISLLAVIIPFIAIFCFKNFRLQKQLCGISVLLILATCLSEFLVVYNYASEANGTIGWSSIVIAPLLALICVLLAVRYINSDKRKLQSYDRLR